MMLSHNINETNRTTTKVRKGTISAFATTTRPLAAARPIRSQIRDNVTVTTMSA